MPRSTSVSKSAHKKYSYTSPKSPVSAPSIPVSHQSMTVKAENPGFFSNMFTGFALGTGQSIAHNIFRSDPVVKHVHGTSDISSEKPKIQVPKEYIQCIQEHNDPKDCEKWLQNHDLIHHVLP